jgi:hypothetical protein
MRRTVEIALKEMRAKHDEGRGSLEKLVRD